MLDIEECPGCKGRGTLVRTWESGPVPFLPGYECIINAPIIACNRCDAFIIDGRIPAMKAAYDDWLYDAKNRVEYNVIPN